MASLPPIFSFTPSRTRVYATAAKGTGGSKEEKGLWDFVLGALTKEEQFYETDPLFKKAEDQNGGGRSGTTGSIGRKNSVSIPQKKDNGGFGGLGGLFSKK